MPAGGFVVAPVAVGIDAEAKITSVVIISCIMAATGGLMFGYDVGISGILFFSRLQVYNKEIDLCLHLFFKT